MPFKRKTQKTNELEKTKLSVYRWHKIWPKWIKPTNHTRQYAYVDRL